MGLEIIICILCWAIQIIDGTCPEKNAERCEADAYFDPIVCACSSCADICLPRPGRSVQSACQRDCPGYLQRRKVSGNTTNVTKSYLSAKPTTVSDDGAIGVDEKVPSSADGDDPLIRKPLFWTSVVSVFISLVATIVLVALCVCKKTRSVLRVRQWMRPGCVQQTQTVRYGEDAKETSGNTHNEDLLRNPETASFPLSLQSYCRRCMENRLPGGTCLTDGAHHVVHPETFPSRDLSSPQLKPCVRSFHDSRFATSGSSCPCSDIHLLEDAEEEESVAISNFSICESEIAVADASRDVRKPPRIGEQFRDLERQMEGFLQGVSESGFEDASVRTASTINESPSPVVSCCIGMSPQLRESFAEEEENTRTASWCQVPETDVLDYYHMPRSAPRGGHPKTVTDSNFESGITLASRNHGDTMTPQQIEDSDDSVSTDEEYSRNKEEHSGNKEEQSGNKGNWCSGLNLELRTSQHFSRPEFEDLVKVRELSKEIQSEEDEDDDDETTLKQLRKNTILDRPYENMKI